MLRKTCEFPIPPETKGVFVFIVLQCQASTSHMQSHRIQLLNIYYQVVITRLERSKRVVPEGHTMPVRHCLTRGCCRYPFAFQNISQIAIPRTNSEPPSRESVLLIGCMPAIRRSYYARCPRKSSASVEYSSNGMKDPHQSCGILPSSNPLLSCSRNDQAMQCVLVEARERRLCTVTRSLPSFYWLFMILGSSLTCSQLPEG